MTGCVILQKIKKLKSNSYGGDLHLTRSQDTRLKDNR